MNVGNEIAAAMDQIAREDEEQHHRERYQRAMRILRKIPSGTADGALTSEQRQAWKEHDAALRWLGGASGLSES